MGAWCQAKAWGSISPSSPVPAFAWPFLNWDGRSNQELVGAVLGQPAPEEIGEEGPVHTLQLWVLGDWWYAL